MSRFAVVLVCAWMAGSAVAEEASRGAVSVEETVRLALANDPAIAAAAGEVEASEGAMRASRGLPHNPEVQVGVLFGPSQGPAGPARVEAQLMQPIAVSGVGRHATRSARDRSVGAESALRRTRLEVAARARAVFLRRVVAEAEVGIAERAMLSAGRLKEASEARFEAGDVPSLDVQLARLEEAGAVAAWLEAEHEVTAARVQWAALTGLSVQTPVLSDPLLAAPRISAELDGPRLDITAAEARLRAARSAVDRERARGLPPIEIGVFAEADASVLAVGPKLTLPLPFKNQNLVAVGAANGALLEAESAVGTTTARAEAERVAASEDMKATERALGLLGDALPEAGAALLGIERGYQAGEFGIDQVLLLRGRIAEGERGWVRARAAIAEARIHVALARELPSLLGPEG